MENLKKKIKKNYPIVTIMLSKFQFNQLTL